MGEEARRWCCLPEAGVVPGGNRSGGRRGEDGFRLLVAGSTADEAGGSLARERGVEASSVSLDLVAEGR